MPKPPTTLDYESVRPRVTRPPAPSRFSLGNCSLMVAVVVFVGQILLLVFWPGPGVYNVAHEYLAGLACIGGVFGIAGLFQPGHFHRSMLGLVLFLAELIVLPMLSVA